MSSYPYIYFVSPHDKYLYRTVCVSTCPDELQIKQSNEPISQFKKEKLLCAPNNLVISCHESLTSDYNSEILIYETVPCKIITISTIDLNVCLPK